MNIGIFTDTYYPQINGVVTSTRELERELTNLGHKVYIFTPKDPRCKEKEENVFRLTSMPFIFSRQHRMTLVYSPRILLTFRKLHLDVIHTQTEFSLGVLGSMISDIHKIPSVHTYHTMYEDYVHYVANGHLITRRMAMKFSQIFCNRADLVISPVEKTKLALTKYGVKKPIFVIPTGLNLQRFAKSLYSKESIDELKSELGLNITDPIVLLLGRVATEKSMDVVIKQFPNVLTTIPNAKLVVVGDGPQYNELVQLVENLGISSSVVFTGSKPWDQIGKYYNLGDVFITASTSETQGLTYIEALASGIPLIAKSDKSLVGVIENGINGYTFQEDEEMPSLICELLKDKTKCAQLVKNGYNTIEEFSSAKFGQRVEAVYNEAINNYKRKGLFDFFKRKINKD